MAYQVIASKTQTDLMREKYHARQGLEGPFLYPSGCVMYYDPKEGAYWDPTTDFYLDHEQAAALQNSVFGAIRNS